jgi:predicted  nucleic acid-binding Zn-ribbon protein
MLLAKIEQLEGELRQKGRALDRSMAAQALLREQLGACIHRMQDTSKQLVGAEINLKNKYKKIRDRIEGLGREIMVLQYSNEAWSNRSINLQFDVLTVKDEARAIKAHNELAVRKIAQLEKELMSVKTENKALRIQFDKINSCGGNSG